MKIGERIRFIRESKGFTQSKLADMIHISPSFMNRIEQGSSMPGLELVKTIADALNVPTQDVLCDLFTYSIETATTSEKIKIVAEKFPPEKQTLLLETLEFWASRLG